MNDCAPTGIPGDEYVKSLVADNKVSGKQIKFIHKAYNSAGEVKNLFDETATVFTSTAVRVNPSVSKKEYVIGDGDIESFRLYYVTGSNCVKLYVSRIGNGGDWFFTNDKYQSEAYDEVDAGVVADKASEKFGIELTLEEVDDEEDDE